MEITLSVCLGLVPGWGVGGCMRTHEAHVTGCRFRQTEGLSICISKGNGYLVEARLVNMCECNKEGLVIMNWKYK